jgi:hypothetical protein
MLRIIDDLTGSYDIYYGGWLISRVYGQFNTDADLIRAARKATGITSGPVRVECSA